MAVGSALNALAPSTGLPEPAQASGKAGAVDYDAFLQLLVAQLKNQDPLNPADPVQFVSQLASLSGLEQSIKQTEKLEQLLSAAGLGQLSSLLGRTVVSADGQVSGTVTAARSTAQGIVATLTGGKELQIGPGVRVQA